MRLLPWVFWIAFTVLVVWWVNACTVILISHGAQDLRLGTSFKVEEERDAKQKP